jgi:polyphosphate kinase
MTSSAITTAANESSGVNASVKLPGSLRGHAELLFNRELSWLEFNRRVLEQALDLRHPALERLKFLAIFSSNLDEFFMVRVSSLKEALEEEVVDPSVDGMMPDDQLKEIGIRLRPMIDLQMRCLREEVLPALAEQGIVLASYGDLNNEEKVRADQYFRESVFPVLTPQAVDPGHPFPYMSNLSTNLGVVVAPPDGTDDELSIGQPGSRFARIKLPPVVPRLIPVDETGTKFTFLGSLIAANPTELCPEMKLGQCHMFRVTRDADFEIKEDEAGDLMRTMQQHLRKRRFGLAVRLEVSTTMPPEMVAYLTESLDLAPEDVYVIDGPLNVPDLMQLYPLDRPELKDAPFELTVPKSLRRGKVFDAIKQRDILVHHPFTAFSTVVDFVKTAAADPDVVAIKMCLYRTGRNSPIVKALIDATERNKQVAVLIELKARFDEESNMEWARQLEQAGVHVVHGMVGLKTHCKLTLVVRREEARLKRYVHLATGNYNPSTARLYTDLGILTADEEIATDATNLFNYLTGFSRYANYQSLLVAPVNLRQRMVGLIERETQHATEGRPARIIAKINSLTDLEIIRALYAASQAGVKIDLIVRGVCMLRPQLPGVSENIHVRSIVGRFLEHSRIFYFGNDDADEMFIGSADWMYRNLSNRVEVVAPIKDKRVRQRLKDIVLAAYLKDNVNSRTLRADGSYASVERAENEEAFDSQVYFQSVEL